jgi:hypothetical protein
VIAAKPVAPFGAYAEAQRELTRFERAHALRSLKSIATSTDT